MFIPSETRAQSPNDLLIQALLEQVRILQARLAELLAQRGQCSLPRDLSLGESGGDVTCLQQFLARDPSIYPEGIVSGYFGTLTERAVQRYQLRWSLSNYGSFNFGVVDFVTRQHISSQGGGGMTFTANPPTVYPGGNATLSWSAPGYTSCSVSGPGVSYSGTSGNLVTGSLYGTTVYSLICVNQQGQSETRNLTINVVATSANLSLTAFPATVSEGARATVTWSAQDVSSCTVSGPGMYRTGLSGSEETDELSVSGSGATSTAVYTLVCQRLGGVGSDTRTATVLVNSDSTLRLTADPDTVDFNGTSTIAWNAKKVKSCIFTGPNVSLSGLIGSYRTPPLPSDTTYTLACLRESGASQTQSITVEVAEQMVLSLSASPAVVAKGDASTITWSASNARSCRLTGPGISSNGPIGGTALSAALNVDSTFVLDCVSAGGTRADKKIRVEVQSNAEVARAIIDDLDAMEDAMRAWGKAAKRTTWWRDTTLGSDPTIEMLVASSTGLGAYLDVAPVPPSTEGGSYKYDNDGNTFACNGAVSAGVNIVLESVRTGVLTQLDELIDGSGDRDCGRFTYAGGTLFYKLSNSEAFVNDAVLKIRANPSTILTGERSTIIWSATNVVSCRVLRGSMEVASGASGQFQTPALSSNTTYTLRCIDIRFGATVSRSALVTVNPRPPSCTLSANPIIVPIGNKSTLTLESQRATTALINQGVGPMNTPLGYADVFPRKTTTYTATVNGPGGEANCNVIIQGGYVRGDL